MKRVICANCFFWDEVSPRMAPLDEKSGSCHRNAPQVRIYMVDKLYSKDYSPEHDVVQIHFPLTEPTDWCGEAQSK